LSCPLKIAEIMVMITHKSVLINRLAYMSNPNLRMFGFSFSHFFAKWSSFRKMVILTAICAFCLLSGCKSSNIRQQEAKPVFFPAPPEIPRLQFLKSFSSSEDLGPVKTSAFEKFIVGEPEKAEGIIIPYGVAIYQGKLYVCDVGKRMVEVLDLKNRTFGYLTKDRRLMNPVNIFIDDDGTKYVTDPTAGLVFVFDQNNEITAMLGKELKINPIDVVVRGSLCYVTDFTSNLVIVLDKITGREITRLGRKNPVKKEEEPLTGLADGEFSLISNLALDREGNIYVTDKTGARITEFDRSGMFTRTIGNLGDNIDEFIRPKGIAIDNQDRIWVVDAGSEVAKIYNQQAQLLLFFGLPGNEPGMMNLPVKIVLDYNNIEYFKQYAATGANLEFLVIVTNQYGLNKVSVYGFGSFPSSGGVIEKPQQVVQTPEPKPERQMPGQAPVFKPPQTEKTESQRLEQQQQLSDIYYRSLTLYKAGQLEKAREGFQEILKSGLLPADAEDTIRGYIAEINSALATDEQKQQIAELYYNSMALYRSGRLEEARDGLTRVLTSGLIPPAMANTIENNLADIDKKLKDRQSKRP
jgi:DNA-binding beta-propeller fold protein YncE